MNRLLLIGDIHGGLLSLQQCLQRCGFDETDTLITIGDIVDGNEHSFEVVEELLKIPRRIDIVGNHDEWWDRFLSSGTHPRNFAYGAQATLDSYHLNCGRVDEHGGKWLDIPDTHKKFFKWQINKFKEEDMVFVHGGFYNFDVDTKSQMMWDRNMLEQAIIQHNNGKGIEERYRQFSDIFIGHTSTTNYSLVGDKIKLRAWMSEEERKIHEPITTPMHVGNIWNVDTGGGGGGKLTIMDVHTKEYWQSDPIPILYPSNTFGLE